MGRTLTHQVIDKAQSMGIGLAEVYILKSKSLTIEVNDREVETLKWAQHSGLGLRVISNGRVGFAYTSDFTRKALDKVVDSARAAAAHTTSDRCNILPAKTSRYPSLDLYDSELSSIPLPEKADRARAIADAAYRYDRRVRSVQKSNYSDCEYEVIICNSQGLEVSYLASFCLASTLAIAEARGDSQIGWDFDFNRFYKNLKVEEVGRGAAHKAVALLGAKTLKTQKLPVIFNPVVAIGFVGLLASALSAEAVQKERSLLKGKLDQQVASSLVNIIDDGTLPQGLGSSPCDGEGVAAQRTQLIQEGMLVQFLHNTYTARKDRVSSTGNGIRVSFKDLPGVGPSNLFMAPGHASKEDLIKGTKRGLYVLGTLGMHTADPISGDFSVGVSGLMIERGELAQPVHGVTISGNLIDLLGSVESVADDLRFLGNLGSPTLSVWKLSISGQ